MNVRFYHEKIPELRELKRIFSGLRYKEIELWPSVLPDVYEWYPEKSRGKFAFKFLRIIKFLLFTEKFKVNGYGKDKILFSILIDRRDHDKLFNSCISSFDKEKILIINALQQGERSFKSVMNRFWFRFPNLAKIFRIWKYLSREGTNKIIKRNSDYVYFILLAYYMFKKIDYWKKIFFLYEPKAYVSYSGYRNNDETIMTQICKKEGKVTIAMQNYALLDYRIFNTESMTYDNIVPDYFLAWGESSKEMLARYIDGRRIIAAGNPLYEKIKRKSSDFRPKTCVMFFDYPQYTQSNFSIIEAVGKFAEKHKDIKFYIKPHPWNEKTDYLDKLKGKKLIWLDRYVDKEEWMSKADFIILHNTTIALEALKYQIPIFRYKDKTLFGLDIPEYNFSNQKELESLFLKVKKEKHAEKYYKSYCENFYQPTSSRIPEYYRKIILDKINMLSAP